MGEWALHQACRDAVTWPNAVGVTVNLSAAQFAGGGLGDTVESALAASGLSPDRLELEITESVLLRDDAAIVATLHRLRKRGVRIALDDFGTAFASLSYLRSFPFDTIKIDRSFVRDLPNIDCAAIIEFDHRPGPATPNEHCNRRRRDAGAAYGRSPGRL